MWATVKVHRHAVSLSALALFAVTGRAAIPTDVDVTAAQFGVGCANPADPLGSQDSLCAILNALAYIEANPTAGASYPRLYFPHGRYLIGTQAGLPAHGTLIYINKAIGLKGDGPSVSVLDNRSPSSSAVVYDNAAQCNGGSGGECPVYITGLTIRNGGARTSGDGIEEINSGYCHIRDVEITNVGGVALNMAGTTERCTIEDSVINGSNVSVHEVGDTNENTFEHVNVINPGFDEASVCYSSPVCTAGKLPSIGKGQTWYASPRPTVYLDGVKGKWADSSIKSLAVDSGIRAPRELGLIENNYFEGGPWGGQPRLNAAIYVGGKMELGHTLAPMTTTSMVVAVDDALFQPGYVNNPADVKKFNGHAGADDFCIYPLDYLVGSTAASTAVPSITRGTSECMEIYGFAGDGNLYIEKRPKAIAWPVNSIVEQVPLSAYGNARIVGNHFNVNDSIAYGPSTYYDGCDDQAQLPSWRGNPSRACASVFLGLVPDGYAVPFPSSTYSPNIGYSATFEDNATFTGNPEADGIGYIKVMYDGTAMLLGNAPLFSLPNLDKTRDTYVNGNNIIKYMHYGNAWAQGMISDAGAQFTSIPFWNFLDATVPVYGQGVVHVSTGNNCVGNLVAGQTATTNLSCTSSSGQVMKLVNQNGAWTAQQ